MYPFGRIQLELWRAGKLPPLGFFEEHQSQIRVYPWDLDIFNELNNGRTLTLYDIARLALAKRIGLLQMIKEQKIGMTVAGISVQYRKRITNLQKITMTAQGIGADERFFYVVQNTYREGEACGQALLRMAFVKNGILPPKPTIEKAFGEIDYPTLPDWVTGYIDAASQRPWPPKGDENG